LNPEKYSVSGTELYILHLSAIKEEVADMNKMKQLAAFWMNERRRIESMD
jgi:hypothetical protein